jgi:hypothetical protein
MRQLALKRLPGRAGQEVSLDAESQQSVRHPEPNRYQQQQLQPSL